MTDKEHRQLEAEIKRVTKEVTKDKAKAKEILFQTGCYTKNGNLKRACR